MRGKKVAYNEIKDFSDNDDPIEFVKLLFDSESTDVHAMPSPVWGDIRAVTHHYARIKNEKLKRKFALAIVSLMDDYDYRGNAIEAAANIPLTEAKEKFIQISKMSQEEVKNFNYSGGNPKHFLLTYCSYYYNDFRDYLISLLKNFNDVQELVVSISTIASREPDFIYNIIDDLFASIFQQTTNKQYLLSSFKLIIATLCQEKGKECCLEICQKIKQSKYKAYYYEALSKSTYFKEYLPEIKKILEIED